MAEQWYAIVFTRDFLPGEHWNPKADEKDPDRKQHWKKGQLYSMGTVLGKTLPSHLKAIPIAPPEEREGKVWDEETEQFRDRTPDEISGLNRGAIPPTTQS